MITDDMPLRDTQREAMTVNKTTFGPDSSNNALEQNGYNHASVFLNNLCLGALEKSDENFSVPMQRSPERV